jgi:hypothetical protein
MEHNPSVPATNFLGSQKSPTYYTNQRLSLTFTTPPVSPFLDHANQAHKIWNLSTDKLIPSCPFPSKIYVEIFESVSSLLTRNAVYWQQ